MINNTLTMMSAQITALNEEKQSLEYAAKNTQPGISLPILKIYGEMRALTMKNEMEIESLDRSNSYLKNEITLLEKQYSKELDTSQMIQSVVQLVVAKIKDIELHFLTCKLRYPEHHHSPQVSEFALLRENLLKLTELKNNETKKLDVIQAEDVLEKAILPSSIMIALDMSILANIDPLLKNEIETVAKKYEMLENKVSPLREENQRLIRQKERIVEIHKQNMDKKDLQSPIKNILEQVKETKAKIEWEQLTKINMGAWPYAIPRFADPDQIDELIAPYIKIFADCVVIGKNQMEGLIITLENMVSELEVNDSKEAK